MADDPGRNGRNGSSSFLKTVAIVYALILGGGTGYANLQIAGGDNDEHQTARALAVLSERFDNRSDAIQRDIARLEQEMRILTERVRTLEREDADIPPWLRRSDRWREYRRNQHDDGGAP